MIQLNNLLISGTSNSSAGSTTTSNTQSSLDSFETALSDALAATLEKFGINPKDVKISIGPATGASNTPTDPVTSPSTGATTPATSTMPSYDPFLQAAYENSPAPAVSSPAPAASSNSTSTPAQDPIQSFDDAYWAKQPEPVQQLRNMPDMFQREVLARDLALQGYKIDVPVMVWHWDASLTTSIRQSAGYTWVPSALQSPVETLPGTISLPGIEPYNPNNPPPGAITV